MDDDKLFNLFSNYGNVLHIKFLHNKPDHALIEMAEGIQAEMALLYCKVLYCRVLYCKVLYCKVLYCKDFGALTLGLRWRRASRQRWPSSAARYLSALTHGF